ncbi:hypothetical protein ABPG75_008281 [Micractinium tetrahymenae]
MKFGHLLKEFGQEAEVPPDALLNYKKLKKLIKAHQQHKEAADGKPAPAAAATAASAGAPLALERAVLMGARPTAAAAQPMVFSGALQDAAAHGVAEEDREFIQTLNEDLSRINSYFMEREEEAIIRLRALQDARADAGASPDQLERLRSEVVDFHGELVLLLHWSLVNYAAVAKILKKHDKLTGSRLRAPVLASVLHQPFLSTESISQLVKEAERDVQELTALCGAGAGASGSDAEAGEGSAEVGRPDMEAEEVEGAGYHVAIYKRTRAALHMLSDMQERASTPSTLLPPSTAQSDAAPDGKKLRTASAQPQQPAAQQQEQSPVEVQAH